MKVAVIGQGYVGLPLAIAAVHGGHLVTGIDTDKKLIQLLDARLSPIEDVSDTDIEEALNTRRFSVSSDFQTLKNAEIVIICVPTPLHASGEPNFAYLESAVLSAAKNLANDALVVIESTVSPGTTRGLVADLLKNSGVEHHLAYSPERIDPTNIKWNIVNTPKLVAGITNEATKRATKFYESFIDRVIPYSSVEVIETAKLLENSYRLINISFINEIAEFCWKMNIDVRDVIDAASTKPYGFMPFYPSIGVGGHCIPVDPSYLTSKAKEVGASTKFIDLANNINHSLPSYFTGVATGILGNLKGKKIVVVGVAYKPNTSDVRETPAFSLIEALRSGGADVSWHDELVKEWRGEKSTLLTSQFDLAILANPHTGTDLSKLGSVRILDARGGY